MAPSMHPRLRLGTSDWHARVEIAFDLERVVRDLNRYVWAILCLRQAHERVYVEAERLDWQIGSDRLAIRLGWLETDLAALGMALPPPATTAWSLPSPDHLLGALYVLNGSALGGQLIFKRVAAGLGLGTGSGARYFHGDGRSTLGFWHAFLENLAEVEPLSPRGDRVEQGAIQTFALLHQLFSDHPLPGMVGGDLKLLMAGPGASSSDRVI